MTEEEKNTVRKLREQGCGYKTISNINGIHYETIKSHLKRHPCVISPSSQCKKDTTGRIVFCKQCGEPVKQDPKHRVRLFCCDECRHTWWAKNKYREGGTPHTFKCLNCGKEFQAFVVKERKYCSHACYIEARFGSKPQPVREESGNYVTTDNAPRIKESREEVNYRLAKWIIRSLEEEQLLEPDEIEEIWTELLSFYAPPTASMENVCDTMNGNGLGKYSLTTQEAGDLDA